MEVGREQMRLHLLAHLGVASRVELLDLRFRDARELPLILRFPAVDVLYVLHLQEKGHVWVQATLL